MSQQNNNESAKIIVQNISHSFNKSEILSDINYTFFKQKYILMGASGIGKTTLLNIIIGNLIPTKGKVFKTAKLGMIFQDFQLLEDFTIEENIKIALNIQKSNNSYLNIIDLLNISHILNKYPNEISGGEQQRAAIARSLSVGADIIIADEPTGNLDNKNTLNIMKIFDLIHKELNIGFIVSSHDLQWENFCDIKLTIENGILK